MTEPMQSQVHLTGEGKDSGAPHPSEGRGSDTGVTDGLAKWSLRIGVSLLAVVALAYGLGLRYNSTASMPEGIYAETAIGSGTVRAGELVMFCPSPEVAAFGSERGYLLKGRCEGGVAPLGKAVIAVAGDTVIVSDRGVSVNGLLVPFTQPLRVDSKGRPLEPVMGEMILTPGQAYVVSNYHGRSFDSRYFGPIRTEQIRGQIRELVTWGNGWEDDPRKIFAPPHTSG